MERVLYVERNACFFSSNKMITDDERVSAIEKHDEREGERREMIEDVREWKKWQVKRLRQEDKSSNTCISDSIVISNLSSSSSSSSLPLSLPLSLSCFPPFAPVLLVYHPFHLEQHLSLSFSLSLTLSSLTLSPSLAFLSPLLTQLPLLSRTAVSLPSLPSS